MNIVLCGCDGTFKTTIAEKLSEKFKLSIVKGSSFELAQGENEELYKFSLDIANSNNQIVDRFIWSNLVYTTLYPEYTALTDKQREAIENTMRDNTIIIYLTASPDVIVKRLEERGDEYITSDKVEDIITTYNSVMSDAVHNEMKVYTYDTGILSSDDIVSQISDMFYTNKSLPAIKCGFCGKLTPRKNSYFSETHCYSCYSFIMNDLLKNGID